MSGLSGAPNFRDLGGALGYGGRPVRRGRLFRSEALLEPSDADAAILAGHGVTLVCDLRSATERRHAPNRWWADRGVMRVEFDLLAGFRREAEPWPALRRDRGRSGAVEAMERVYGEMPRAAARHLLPLFDAVLASEGACLIHCTAGKDRTGFVSAVLLAALGVGQDAIMADYLASRGRRTARVATATHRLVQVQVGEITPEALEALLDVDARYLDTSLQVIADEYGGLPDYLQAAGVGPDRIVALRARLLA